MIRSVGKIMGNGVNQKPGWFYLKADDDLSLYYAWFCQMTGSWDLPMNGCHITFIAGEREDRIISSKELDAFMNDDIEFFYENKVMTDGRSFWIDCKSPQLDKIREDLGLPEKWRGLHITLGNLKNRK